MDQEPVIIEECDNCGKTATHAVSGGHDDKREFWYCDSCLPPVGKEKSNA